MPAWPSEAEVHRAVCGMTLTNLCDFSSRLQLYKGVCELGHWAEKFLTAYFAYKDGDIDSSLIQYALLAEMGYEVAQSNSAFILESSKIRSLQFPNPTYSYMHTPSSFKPFLMECPPHFLFLLEKAKILGKEKMYPMALLLWNRAAIQGIKQIKIGM